MKFKYVLLLLSSVLFFSSCNISMESKIERTLGKRYDKSFSVESIDKNEKLTGFDKTTYSAVVRNLNTGTTFDVILAEDGEYIKDNFQNYIFREDIDFLIETLLSVNSSIKPIDSYAIWGKTEESYASASDYLDDSAIVVSMDVSVDGTDTEDISNKVFKFLNDLSQFKIQYNITCTFKINGVDKTVFFVVPEGSGNWHSYKDVVDKITQA